MRNILSIRGGGIRGIIPCCCLIALEKRLRGLTRDHVDMCAGTSTGALLTAAVAAGIPATDLLKVYPDRSDEIFTSTGAAAAAKRLAVGFMYDPTTSSMSWSASSSGLVYVPVEHEGNLYESEEEEDRTAELVSDLLRLHLRGGNRSG